MAGEGSFGACVKAALIGLFAEPAFLGKSIATARRNEEKIAVRSGFPLSVWVHYDETTTTRVAPFRPG